MVRFWKNNLIATRRALRSKRSTNLRLLPPAFLCVSATLTLVFFVIAQPQTGRREIVSDDFTKSRPKPTPKPVRLGAFKIEPIEPRPSPPKHYRFAATSSPNAGPLTSTDTIEQLGITLWRLRPARKIETGERMLVRENNKSSEWIPERIEMDTPLKIGDRVRLSIESPREGYLYVVDRDLYADGTLGDAKLIFPTRSLRGGKDQVRPGKLIDLPWQDDTPNYFAVRLSNSQGSYQVGEVLTIIVSTSPLDLAAEDQPSLVSVAGLAKMEKQWGSETERFEMEGGSGQSWTKAEKEASSATGSRQLTRDQPPPQTIYRIAATNKTVFLINVRLSYKRLG